MSANWEIPTAFDDLVRDARAIVEKLRRQCVTPEDFDRLIRPVIEYSLHDLDPKAVAWTMRVIGMERDKSHGW